jgi:hypothetical protein
MSSSEKITSEEVRDVVHGLSKIEPGVLPFDIFHAVTRVVATPIVELVPLRRNHDGKPEILLLRREADDPVWPNQLHVPGTVVRASDEEGSFKDAFGRISKELGGIALEAPTLVKNIIHHSGRGMEVSQIYWTDVSGLEQAQGEFFPADNLPEEIVQSQLDFIPEAVAHFTASTHQTLNR